MTIINTGDMNSHRQDCRLMLLLLFFAALGIPQTI